MGILAYRKFAIRQSRYKLLTDLHSRHLRHAWHTLHAAHHLRHFVAGHHLHHLAGLVKLLDEFVHLLMLVPEPLAMRWRRDVLRMAGWCAP